MKALGHVTGSLCSSSEEHSLLLSALPAKTYLCVCTCLSSHTPGTYTPFTTGRFSTYNRHFTNASHSVYMQTHTPQTDLPRTRHSPHLSTYNTLFITHIQIHTCTHNIHTTCIPHIKCVQTVHIHTTHKPTFNTYTLNTYRYTHTGWYIQAHTDTRALAPTKAHTVHSVSSCFQCDTGEGPCPESCEDTVSYS